MIASACYVTVQYKVLHAKLNKIIFTMLPISNLRVSAILQAFGFNFVCFAIEIAVFLSTSIFLAEVLLIDYEPS